MQSLRTATAQLLGSLMQWVKVIVWRIQVAGRVNRVRTTKAGNNFSAQVMLLQHLWSPAKVASPKKRKAAKPTTAASKSTSKKPSPARTGKSPSSRGNSTQTPVRQTRQPAAPAAKRKRSVAKQDTQAPSRK